MRKRLALTLATAVVGSLALVAPPAQASHSWGGYHWARTTTTFTLNVGANLTTADWVGQLSQAQADWNALATPLGLASVAGTSNKRCSATAGTVQVCNGRYGRNGWLGLASINITGGTHITQGTAKMNDTYFDTSTYNNPNERLHVMCQEVGHTFGLDHQSTDGLSQNTCMDYFSNTGANAGSTLSTKPNAHDAEELGIIYGHTDSTTTLAASSGRSAGRDVGDDAATWGTEIERGTHGEFSIFERDFGGGEKVITHVTWALDAPAGRAGA